MGGKTDTDAAFTMIELLVGMGIVLVLAITTFATSGRLFSMLEATTCASNLRQVGMGILAHANDNNSVLPGPLLSAQWSYRDNSSQLSWQLREYLEVNQDITRAGRKDVFMCPAFFRYGRTIRNFQAYNVPAYGMNIQVLMDGQAGWQQPFGYANSREPQLFHTTKDFPPMRLADLDRIVDASGRPARSTTWAMRDADRQDGRFSGFSYLPPPRTPIRPVHGDRRLALFFDFHVGPMPLNP
jgi:hypothetical protein